MKKLLLTLFIIFILFPVFIFSQTYEECGTVPLEKESLDLTQEGGLWLTSQGELKVLFVFARFKDDWSYHPYWDPTLVGEPPDNYTTYIDADLQANSTHYINLTHYYKKMSLDVFKVTGQAVYVVTDENQAYYFNPANYGAENPRYFATKKILQDKVDPLINFNDFDNWSSSSNYIHPNVPDGTIDMIVMVWRASSVPFPLGSWGEASLGYGPSYTVANGTKTIKAGLGLNAGSGVTCHYWGERSPNINFKVIIHEIGHWLLGRFHPYNSSHLSQNDRHEIWGILSSPGSGICANTYERERVAWINPTPITGDILNAPFQDYVEYGAAYKYHPPNGATMNIIILKITRS